MTQPYFNAFPPAVEVGDKVLAHLGIDTEPTEVLVSSTGRRGDDHVFFYDGHTKWEYIRKVVKVVSQLRESLYERITKAAEQHGIRPVQSEEGRRTQHYAEDSIHNQITGKDD